MKLIYQTPDNHLLQYRRSRVAAWQLEDGTYCIFHWSITRGEMLIHLCNEYEIIYQNTLHETVAPLPFRKIHSNTFIPMKKGIRDSKITNERWREILAHPERYLLLATL